MRPAGADRGEHTPGASGQREALRFAAYHGGTRPPSADRWPAWVGGLVLLAALASIALIAYLIPLALYGRAWVAVP